MKEQRSFHRLSMSGKVVFEDRDIPDSPIMDISYSGIAIYSKKKFELGQHLSFELKMDLVYEPIKCKGIVKYIIEKHSCSSLIYKIGIEFIGRNKDNITFVMKRIQSVFADAQKRKANTKSPDFIPY